MSTPEAKKARGPGLIGILSSLTEEHGAICICTVMKTAKDIPFRMLSFEQYQYLCGSLKLTLDMSNVPYIHSIYS